MTLPFPSFESWSDPSRFAVGSVLRYRSRHELWIVIMGPYMSTDRYPDWYVDMISCLTGRTQQFSERVVADSDWEKIV